MKGDALTPAVTVQAHQGFLRAFNSVTNTTGHRNNILKAWKDMSSVPPEQVTRYDLRPLHALYTHACRWHGGHLRLLLKVALPL